MQLLRDPFPLLEHLQPSQLSAAAFGLVVQPGVFHRYRCLRRENHQHAFVLVVERVRTLLVREVDVAEDPASSRHGRSQQRSHRRMVRREPDGPGVRGDVRDP